MFSLAVFLFPVIKRGKKVSGFVFSVRGEGKCQIDYKKKENFFFSIIELFNKFWWLVCRKRILGSVSGVRRRSREKKKVIVR